jgi:hypothetical protein
VVIQPVVRPQRRKSIRRVAFWIAAAAILACAVGLGFALLRPKVGVATDSEALGRISLSGLEGRVVSVSAQRVEGGPVRIALRNGKLWPQEAIPVRERVLVRLTLRRPSWAGWLLGRTARKTFALQAPIAHLRQRWLLTPSSGPVTVAFSPPVREVRIREGGRTRTLRFPTPHSRIVVGRMAPGRPGAGSAMVSAVPRNWETMPRPVRVNWFPAGNGIQALAEPSPGAPLPPEQPITITFAKPVRQVLGGRFPSIGPDVHGRWEAADTHTITFKPARFGYPLGRHVAVHLPAKLTFASQAHARTLRTVAWNVPEGSILRLHQLLAQAGYLPVAWQPATDSVPTARSEAAAAIDPPAGRFTWRYANTPRELRAMWKPADWNEITRGAVMMFEDTHGLDVDGFVGPKVWNALLTDTLAGHHHGGGYSYVYVHRNLPQSLNLWHNGKVILTSPGNTGVPAAPTQLGTFPVFEHIPIGTMSGTNPDGTHYHDPGIRYISYFNHGDAIHAFTRASFGTPQSLGCVELPLAAAATVWPYTPIGTLVTIEN